MIMENNFKGVPVYENINGKCDIDDNIILTAKPDAYSITRAAARFTDITGGKVYEITVPCNTDNIAGANARVIASWLNDKNNSNAKGEMYSRCYLLQKSDGIMALCYHVPENVNAVEIEYRLWSYGGGKAVFGMPKIECKGDYKPRIANLASAWFNTSTQNRTLADNLADILRVADNAGKSSNKPDLIVFSEAIYGRGISLPLPERALKLDSEAVRKICGKAKEYQMYIAVGLHIDDGGLYKNVTLIIDRKGDIAHIYTKTHLTMTELEGGLVPGSELPVFDLDFGRVGVLICWDHFFSEPERILHQKGAEVIIIPTAGDTLYQSRARAADTGAYLIMGGTKEAASSIIINPYGEIIASVADNPEQGFACAEVDLNQRNYIYWLSVGPSLGEGKDIYLKERRSDLYGEIAQDIIY